MQDEYVFMWYNLLMLVETFIYSSVLRSKDGRGEVMEQEIDEGNKIIHVKCTAKERDQLLAELTPYLYDYQFHFIIMDEKQD